MRGEQTHFIDPHEIAEQLVVAALAGRRTHRTAMNKFASTEKENAPSYLCWYAEEPVGKTALLADYAAVHRPREIDVLNFFVSAVHGTDRRSAFEAELTAQLAQLLEVDRLRVPGNLAEWQAVFTAAAGRSRSRSRRLLLIVDGLDDDLAWSGLTDGEGSIAALLPRTPPDGMRVIVSVRNFRHFPADLPRSHPLRRPRHRCELSAVPEVTAKRRTPPTKTPLGTTVTELLAVARGGLRPTDLAELTGAPTERIDRLLHGPEGRDMCLDDRVSGTYRLAREELVDDVRELLGTDGIARYTRTLLTWSAPWHDADWPADTPPYPLTHELRLRVGAVDRSTYVLDLARLRRLVESTAPWVAIGQLDAFAAESGAIGLEVSVPLAATRALLTDEAREVPPGAPALLVRLGDAANARGLARFTPGAAAKAMRLAEVAVETAVTGRDGADTVAQEAADWLARVDDLSADPGTYARITAAARALMKHAAPKGATALVRAVLRAPAPGPEALTAAAGLLATLRDERVATALFERAEDLISEGEWRSRAAAVEIWGMLGRAVPSLRTRAADAICDVCQDVQPADGLGAVEILAVAAIVLARQPSPRYRRAKEFTSEALARIHTAWPDPDVLSEDDRAHLCRELGGALARLTQAVDVSGRTREDLADIKEVLDRMPEQLRMGALGDDTAEQAWHLTAAAQERREVRARNEAAARREAKNKKRREAFADERKTQRRYPNTAQPPEPRRPAGLPELGNDPPEHVLLLHRAYEHHREGEQAAGRASVTAALKCFPVPTRCPLPGGWTTDLAQALGTAGDFAAGRTLADARDDPADRVRHFAALSLGCSLGGHTEAGLRYAHDAARLLSAVRDASLANLVARALGWAGDAPGATALATGAATQRTQALTAAAAGLVRHHPDEAARIADPLVGSLTQRVVRGSRLLPFPELAALLLAYPDVRNPDPVLHEALGRAAEFAAELALSGHRSLPPVLPVLERLGCLPGRLADTVANAAAGWRQQPSPGLEFALICAMDGDVPALLRHVDGQALPLWTAAAYFTGTAVPLAADNRARDNAARTCVALAHASGHTATPGATTGVDLARSMVGNGDWTNTISLLPDLAPDALPRLAAVAR